MKKLTLQLDALTVESFATRDAAADRGTVQGMAWTDPLACDTNRQCKTILTYCPCTPMV